MPAKNILLFRGENTTKLKSTIHAWRERFVEKHGEMNLLEIRDDTIFDGVLADCLTPGFMGWTRMVIFHEQLIRTQKEQDKITEKQASETVNMDEVLESRESDLSPLENDTLWIETLKKIPDTNFVLFVGNKKSITELEKWLENNATIHEFSGVTPREMEEYILQNLSITGAQARAFCQKLGFYEEIKWWKSIIVGKPDFIYTEVEKLKLSGKTTWTNAELDSVLPDYRDENAFNMLDPLWERQADTMIDIWKRLMETADHELTVAMMITMIRKVLIAATFPSLGDVPITPWQKKTGQRLASHKKSIKNLYDRIVAVDIAEKSGELPHKTNAFLMALLSFCA